MDKHIQFRVYDVEEMEQAATGLAGILSILENDDVERQQHELGEDARPLNWFDRGALVSGAKALTSTLHAHLEQARNQSASGGAPVV